MDKTELIKHMKEYLMSLQNEKSGVPTLEDLQNAELLHQFIEKNVDFTFPIHSYFFVGVKEENLDKYHDMLLRLMDDYDLNPVMKYDKPDEYVYLDANKKYVLFAYCRR